MHKRIWIQLLLCGLIILACRLSVMTLTVSRAAATPAFKMLLSEAEGLEALNGAEVLRGSAALNSPEAPPPEIKRDRVTGKLKSASSGQRVVEYNVLEQTSLLLEPEEYDTLLRIVEAEAGSEDERGRMLVAGVVLNRVKNPKFPGTVREVVFQQQNGTCQFSPISNGRFHSVKVSEATVKAVERVLAGEDVTEGALYFAARKYASPEKMQWFDTHLTLLFSHGGHEFFY